MVFLVVLSLVVAVAALAVAVLGLRRAPSSGGDVDALPEDVLGLRQEVAALRAEATGAIRHLGIVRYDAFGDVGGRLSWSLALLDDGGDGVVLTAIHGRSEARSYAKSVAGWTLRPADVAGGGGRRGVREAMTHARDWDDLADELGVAAVADGEPTRWYDELWSAAGRGEVALPWDHTDPHPVLADWVAGTVAGTAPARPAAVVVGCGLGADSEHLAAHGWRTIAFDISPAAVAAVRDRYPDSSVDYREGDLLDLPDDLVGAFDLVVEIYTLQALHPSLRDRAVAGVHEPDGAGRDGPASSRSSAATMSR